jgi:exosortase H (IPTLxxWG-CTERM-specific)
MHTARTLAGFFRRQSAGVRICTRFAVYTVLVFATLYAVQDGLIGALNRHFAGLTAQLLRLVGMHTSSSGPVVTLGRFAVEIKDNCNAIYEVGLYAAAVWAYPASWRARLLGTLLGASVLYGVNLLRIVTLLTAGVLLPDWFEVLHLYVWQILYLLVVAACWFVWVSGLRPGA